MVSCLDRTTNKEPKLIRRWYLEYLFENKVMPSYLRMDRGTETGVMSTIHAFLHRHHDMDVDLTATVIYGPSTANQVMLFTYILFCFYV